MVETDKTVSLREICQELRISHGSARNILQSTDVEHLSVIDINICMLTNATDG